MVLSFEASPFWREMMYVNILATSGDMSFRKELNYSYFWKKVTNRRSQPCEQFIASQDVEGLFHYLRNYSHYVQM